MNQHMLTDPWLIKNKPEVYLPMLQTAEIVAKRYNIGRDAMDEVRPASNAPRQLWPPACSRTKSRP